MLPEARGEISECLLDALPSAPRKLRMPGPAWTEAPLADEDLQLALYLLYELHYRGLPGVGDDWEWNLDLLSLRAELESEFTRALLDAVPRAATGQGEDEIDRELQAIAQEDSSPSLSMYIRGRASLAQVREFLVHRSAYQLKEADPHSWAIPRLAGGAKAALIEIQYDEYGSGRAEWMHAALFARAMDALGLDSRYGAYLDVIPAVTLATNNLMSMFGLHRRWRGAIVGHLALFEMSSSIPNRRYGDGLRRLGLGAEATLFFDEHVTADAVHENIAAVDLAGGLVAQEPGLREDVLWGARTLAHLEDRWSRYLIEHWEQGSSSLLGELLPAGDAVTV